MFESNFNTLGDPNGLGESNTLEIDELTLDFAFFGLE